MISKQLFKKCMNAIIELNKYEDKIYEATDGAICLFEIRQVQQVMSCLEELLSYNTKDKYDDMYGSDISYFLYELGAGRNYKPGALTDTDGNDIPLKDVDDLWNYLVSNNPDIKDEDKKEDDINTFPTEEELNKAVEIIAKTIAIEY